MGNRTATLREPADGSTPQGFVPALRFGVLTPASDSVVRCTTRDVIQDHTLETPAGTIGLIGARSGRAAGAGSLAGAV